MEIDQWITKLRGADVADRRAAVTALSRDGGAAAVIPFVQACGDVDEQVREAASAALEDLGPPPLDTAPQLAEHLKDSGLAAYWSATLLGRLQTAAAPWTPALAQAIGQDSDASVRQRAAWALGEIGPGAAAAIPVLESAKQDPDPRLARLAAAALRKISGGA